MNVLKVNLLVLKTHQLDRLRAFCTALGIAFTEEKHGDGPTHFAGRVGDLLLELYPLPADAGSPDSTTRLGFTVPALDAAVRSLTSARAVVVSEAAMTLWGRRAVVRDPDGRKVELMQGGGTRTVLMSLALSVNAS